MSDELLNKLAQQFGVRRRRGSIPSFTILGIDWGLKPKHIRLRFQKRIVIW